MCNAAAARRSMGKRSRRWRRCSSVVPAVVNINSARVRVRNPFLDDPTLRQFFGMQNVPRERIAQSLAPASSSTPARVSC
jgi:hypothetical protein